MSAITSLYVSGRVKRLFLGSIKNLNIFVVHFIQSVKYQSLVEWNRKKFCCDNLFIRLDLSTNIGKV